MAQYDINLRDYFRILRRRKGILILVPLLFGLSSFALALFQAPPPLYRAKTVVRIERAVSFAGFLQELVTFSPVGNLETQTALIKGFPVLSAAAKKLGLIPPEATPDQIRASPAYLKAIQDLQERLEVKPVENASLIEISVTSSDPEQAILVANRLAEAFQEDNLATRSRQVREAREFIERQLEEVDSRLRQSENELKTFKETNKAFLLPEGTREVVSRLAALQADHAGIRQAIAETETQFRLLEQGKALGRQTDLSPAAADPALAKLSTSLSDLTLERENLLTTLLPAHPQVKQLDVRIAQVRSRLGEALRARLQALRARANDIQKGLTRLRQEEAAIPEAALKMARMEREVKLSEKIFSLLKEKHHEVLIKEKEQGPEVSLVRPAIGPLQPINPPQALPKAAIGLVIGLVVGFVLAFVMESLDTSIGAIDEVESLLGTPVLGVIPHLDVKAEWSDKNGEAVGLDRETLETHGFLASLLLPRSRFAEAILALRTNLLFSGLERDVKTIMVTSSTQMEGKTTVAVNLAIALAQLGKRTLLVEADLRNPYLHHAFGLPKEPGFTEAVIGSVRLDEAIRSFPDFMLGKAGVEVLMERPGIENLFLLCCGHQPPNPVEFLNAQAVANFLAEARQRYDHIVLDCAPILPVADASVLSSRVDGTLVVVRVGQVPRAALRRAKALLEAAKARILGVCLSGVRAEVSPDYAEMAYYHYGARHREPSPSPGWLGLLSGFKEKLKHPAILLLLLLALAIGTWAWRAGLLRLPFLTASVLETARVVNSDNSGPLPLGPPLVDLKPPAEKPTQPSKPDTLKPPNASSEPRYTIQLHAFRSEQKAHQAVARYRARGLPAFSAEALAPGPGRWWRVFVGEFKTPDEAKGFGRDLIQEGTVDKFLVVENASGS